MSLLSPSRRRLVLFAATALGSTLLPGRGWAGPDQGIGGTGTYFGPIEDESDRGIGGTGVIGTIRKFGSIIVNDMRIAYPANAAVFIDGQPASVADLKIGQVVRVVAHRGEAGLATQSIDVSSEVVGTVERVASKSLMVLGQPVSTASLRGTGRFAVGDRVAVSGLRRTDGTIVASLIEPRAHGLDRATGLDRGTSLDKVAGPVTQAHDGGLRIGGLRVTGLGGDLIGQRAVLFGDARGARFVVSRSVGETGLFPSEVKRLSVEAYVERRGDTLKLGSGLAVAGRLTTLPEGRPIRAVLTTSVGTGGRLTVDSLRSGGARYQAAPRSGKIPDGPGGTRPMDFEHGPGNGLATGDRGLDPGAIGRGGPGLGGSGLGGSGLGGSGLGAPGLGVPGLGAPGAGLPGGHFGGGRR